MANSTTKYAPHADYGLLGPDSVAWKVFSYPTGTTVGVQRTAVVEMFDPFVLAAVADTGAVLNRTKSRYERSMQYIATTVFADTATALKASQTLIRIHHRIGGIEPISGLRYDPNDPEGQLWIHLTIWHSVLLAYEMFGPGKLTPSDEAQYWRECAVVAELQNINLHDVPQDREQMRAYYERVQARLAATAATQETVAHYLIAAGYLLPDHPLIRPLRPVVGRILRTATIATLPRRMRSMAGVQQSKVTDTAIVLLLRPTFRMIASSKRVQVAMVETLSPLTARVLLPVILELPATEPVVRTPDEARQLHGIRTPAEQISALKSTDAGGRNRTRAPRDGTEPLVALLDA